MADTDPTNSDSFFFAASGERVYGTNFTETIWTNGEEVVTARICEVVGHVYHWPSAAGRVYDVYAASNVSGPYLPLTGATNIPATPAVNTFTNILPETVSGYYRIRVRRE